MIGSAGKAFRQALSEEKPLQIIGTPNAYISLMAKATGFRAIYLSGAVVSNASYALPDLGLTTLDNVLCDARRITAASDLPLLVDIDTGWGGPLMVQRTIGEMIRAGVAAVHMEDQDFHKRCGHRPGKTLADVGEVVEKIQAAVEAKTDPDFVFMARTDAAAVEGLNAAIERAQRYIEAGAEMIFAEALTSREDYQAFRSAIDVPLLANLTEFGKTPLFTVKEMGELGMDMLLYPVSAARAMHRAALELLQCVREKGTQHPMLERMQTRDELYKFLNYHAYEEALNSK